MTTARVKVSGKKFKKITSMICGISFKDVKSLNAVQIERVKGNKKKRLIL